MNLELRLVSGVNGDGHCKWAVTRQSLFTGETNTVEMWFKGRDFDDWNKRKKLIQDAFPYLDTNEREFLMTGAVEDEWDDSFPCEDH